MDKQARHSLYELIAELNLLAIEVESCVYFGANRTAEFPPTMLKGRAANDGLRLVKNASLLRHKRYMESEIQKLIVETRRRLKEGLAIKAQER